MGSTRKGAHGEDSLVITKVKVRQILGLKGRLELKQLSQKFQGRCRRELAAEYG